MSEESEPLKQHDFAWIINLQKREDLNKSLCELIKFHESRGRWEVLARKANYKPFAIKPANLVFVDYDVAVCILLRKKGFEFMDKTKDFGEYCESTPDRAAFWRGNVAEKEAWAVDWTAFESNEYTMSIAKCYKAYVKENSLKTPLNMTLFLQNSFMTIGGIDRESMSLKDVADSVDFTTDFQTLECVICYDPIFKAGNNLENILLDVEGGPIGFFGCPGCRKILCVDCYPQLRSRKCPMCRSGMLVPNTGKPAASSTEPENALRDMIDFMTIQSR